MSEEVFLAKLMASSDAASQKAVQHVVVAVAADGRLRVNGSAAMVDSLMSDPELLHSLSNKHPRGSPHCICLQLSLSQASLLSFPR